MERSLAGTQISQKHWMHFYQRGFNEHTKGLLREFIPKKTDFQKLS